MSNPEDNNPVDNELKAYLAGEDGVSAAYRQAGSEEPPAELDMFILAAARNAVQQDGRGKPRQLRRHLPMAASFMVGVLVTSMYFNESGDNAGITGVADTSEQQLITQVINRDAPALAPAAPPAATAPDPRAAELERNVAQQPAQFTQQAARDVLVVAEAPAAAQSKAQSSDEAARIDNAFEAQIEADAATQETARQVASTAAAPQVAGNTSDTRAEADAAGTQLEEISITGSRVSSASELDVDYRQSREEWFQQILALEEQAIEQVEQLEDLNAQLEEEMLLFSEAFPDVDLDAELRQQQP